MQVVMTFSSSRTERNCARRPLTSASIPLMVARDKCATSPARCCRLSLFVSVLASACVNLEKRVLTFSIRTAIAEDDDSGCPSISDDASDRPSPGGVTEDWSSKPLGRAYGPSRPGQFVGSVCTPREVVRRNNCLRGDFFGCSGDRELRLLSSVSRVSPAAERRGRGLVTREARRATPQQLSA